MDRRSFVHSLVAAASATVLVKDALTAPPRFLQERLFTMKFSPRYGLFTHSAGEDPVDQIKFAHDQGFRAWEDTQLRWARSREEQERVSRALQELRMAFGQFVCNTTFNDVTFAGRNAEIRARVLDEIRSSVAVARRMNTTVTHTILGHADPKLPWDFQMSNAIELLKRAADIYEPEGLVMVIEPMNHKIDHPNMFLHSVPQAHAIVKAVGSPSVKILFDIYHVQIQEGNLLPTYDYAQDEIGYLQVGDTPGRKEPTTGEINYWNVLQHIHDSGYRGFVGLEHGLSKPGLEGEQAMIEAYRSIDPD